MNRVHYGKASGGDHRLAAAPAAIADEVDVSANVLTELYQVVVIGFGQKVQPFGDTDRPGMAVANQGFGRGVERHADVHRGAARPAHVRHLVATVAHADAPG